MKTLRTACGAAAAILALVGCGNDDQEKSKARDERETAVAYVEAINDRDVTALVRLSPPGNAGAEKEARDIVAAEGGRGLRVDDIKVTYEFGPEIADAQVQATDSKGTPFHDTLTLTRRGKTWYVALGSRPGSTPKPPAQTARPSSGGS